MSGPSSPTGHAAAASSRTAVVIASWTGRSFDRLRELCRSIERHDAGADFDLVLCVNGIDFELPADLVPHFRHTFARENTGLNLGAWDHAWRRLPDHHWFLFLQDDCRVRRDGWLRDFHTRFAATPRCGLVGECMLREWDRPWAELTDPGRGFPFAEATRFYRGMLARWEIPEGETARHVTTVVHFTSRAVLEEVEGYNLGRDHEEAVAAEIGFSCKVRARGYAVVQLARHRHRNLAHPQWPSTHPLEKLKRSFWKRVAPSKLSS